MRRSSSRSIPTALAALVAVATVAACRSDTGHQDGDSALSRDLTLAAAVTPATLPALGDTVAPADTAIALPRLEPVRTPTRRAADAPARSPRSTTPPPRPAPTTAAAPAPTPEPTTRAPAPAAAGPAEGAAPSNARSVGAGTQLALSTGARVCNTTTRPGDRLVATLVDPIAGGPPDGSGILLPAGTQLVLEVASIGGGQQPGDARIEFLARGVSLGERFVPIVADVPVVQAPAERKAIAKPEGQDKGKVIKGAIAGAILGRVLGGSAKGAVIGAAAGAATGAATAAASTKYEVCVAPHLAVAARLIQPLLLP